MGLFFAVLGGCSLKGDNSRLSESAGHSSTPRPSATSPAPATHKEANLKTSDEIEESEIHTVLAKDAIASIDDPKFEYRELPDSTAILGLEIGGEARAYPVAILSSHEIVNDRFGDQPVAITW